jgi:hypothetical protein
MANTINWNIEWMNTSTQTINGFSEVVLTAGWRCTGTDGNNTTSVYNTCSFPEPVTGDETFIAYADLTQEQVLAWCYENGVDKDATESTINSNLASLENPPVIQSALPWNKVTKYDDTYVSPIIEAIDTDTPV